MSQNTNPVYNFSAGPSALPLTVLEKAQRELVDFNHAGMSIMEMSHRGPVYEDVHNEAIARLKRLLAIPENYEVLFLQGGASLQFSMIPMNFLSDEQKAHYISTGSWSEKAFKEAKLFGQPYASDSTKNDNYKEIPSTKDLQFNDTDAYVHLTSNNTIYGTQWKQFPNTKDVPLIADMSSDIMSRPIDINQFGMIYAGAQKNLGPSGVTVVIIRKDLIEKENEKVPTILKYSTHTNSNSLYHTPPTFGIYMLGEVLRWIEDMGGLEAAAKRNEEKANYIYDVIDESNGFYTGHADRESRSLMNITFRVTNEVLEKKFLVEAAEAGFVGLNGHRSVGGCRASAYNAVPTQACTALSNFMKEFQKNNS